MVSTFSVRKLVWQGRQDSYPTNLKTADVYPPTKLPAKFDLYHIHTYFVFLFNSKSVPYKETHITREAVFVDRRLKGADGLRGTENFYYDERNSFLSEAPVSLTSMSERQVS